MGFMVIIPVLIALIVITIFVLNMLEIVTIEKSDTPLARVLLVVSFLIVFVFVLWFVIELMGPIQR